MAALTTAVSNKQKQNSEERMAAARTTDFLRKAQQLRKLVDNLKKETKLKYYSSKSDLGDCFCPLLECENKLNSDFTLEIMRVQQQLQKIRHGVSRFQGQLINAKSSPELIEKIKDIMTEIENSISVFKEQQHQSFEELLKEEKTCWMEISALEKRIDAWSVKKADELSVPPKARAYSVKQGKEEIPEDVTALETFLEQSGGKLGGWDQYDHQSFLRIWNKHHGKPSYRKEVKLYLPCKTEEDIRQHEDWYLEFCHLQEKKKEAIQKWREDKQRERQARLQSVHRESDTDRKEKEVAALEAQRHRQEEERREAAARLQAWREERRQQQRQKEEQRLKEEILRRKRAEEERRRQLEVKMTVERHLRQKREEEELCVMMKEEQEQTEMEERRRLAAEGIRQFQERDLHKLEAKLKEKQAREEEELERLTKQAKLKEKAERNIYRDASRLWKPTKGWEERTKEIGPTGGGPVYQTSRRAVPSWRQDL